MQRKELFYIVKLEHISNFCCNLVRPFVSLGLKIYGVASVLWPMSVMADDRLWHKPKFCYKNMVLQPIVETWWIRGTPMVAMWQHFFMPYTRYTI
jgi:hypothetical protein